MSLERQKEFPDVIRPLLMNITCLFGTLKVLHINNDFHGYDFNRFYKESFCNLWLFQCVEIRKIVVNAVSGIRMGGPLRIGWKYDSFRAQNHNSQSEYAHWVFWPIMYADMERSLESRLHGGWKTGTAGRAHKARKRRISTNKKITYSSNKIYKINFNN